MARNKRKSVKDKDNLKQIRKEARKRWRNKKAAKKALKNEAIAEKETRRSIKRKNPAEVPESRKQVVVQHHLKEIDPSLVVRTEKFLGCGAFGSCYLAYYRDVVVAVKEFKTRKVYFDYLKKEVPYEAKMISHLEDHHGVPLLFGIVTKSEPLRLITKFHGNKNKSFTLSSLMKREKLEKPIWLGIVKLLIEALIHIHSGGILHNDLKSNNVVMERREQQWNPVVIDFGKHALLRLLSQLCCCLPRSKKSIRCGIRTLPQKLWMEVAGRVSCQTFFPWAELF